MTSLITESKKEMRIIGSKLLSYMYLKKMPLFKQGNYLSKLIKHTVLLSIEALDRKLF